MCVVFVERLKTEDRKFSLLSSKVKPGTVFTAEGIPSQIQEVAEHGITALDFSQPNSLSGLCA